MTTILVPVDGSVSSQNAVKAALDWTKGRSDISLHVITIQPPILSGNVSRFVSAQTIHDYYQEEGQKALDAVKPLLEGSGVECKQSVEIGPIAQTIVDYANAHKADYIIMGTRGLSPVSGLLLGSVATKVLSLVNIPVTLVK
ncbi:universal stress protein [Paracandidimonas soli]|uniref:Nucleotide-binding universal stress UspA family protein n=1 Tax=Paracandidimonas soli TaxID=1917182 RepID=A0A4R3VD13_9BURK|nr:universal stress protein [Paracandidimonas soli]TCV01743.1 nucleotide-binding universal stress UspA family protein [Paracandidimonas soli]